MTRPTSDRIREAWMSSLAPRIPGARVLDLFAGSGALGLECLSRGAEEAVFVERSRGALRTLRANIRTLEAEESGRVIQGDALAFVEGLEPHAFDLALADPPYDRGYGARVAQQFLRVPFARELWIEHRTGDPPAPSARTRTRRYGDTSLTILEAPG